MTLRSQKPAGRAERGLEAWADCAEPPRESGRQAGHRMLRKRARVYQPEGRELGGQRLALGF